MSVLGAHLFATIFTMSERGEEIGRRIGVLGAQINSATAELVRLSGELEEDSAWYGVGMRTCAHWLSINIGANVWTGGEILRVARAHLPSGQARAGS